MSSRTREIEVRLLSTLAKKPEKVFDVDGDWLSRGDFMYEGSKCVYSAIVELANQEKPIDPLTIEDQIAQFDRSYYNRKQAQLSVLIRHIWKTSPTEKLMEYVRMTVDRAIRRRTKKYLKELHKYVDEAENYSALLSHLQNETYKFTAEQLKTSNIVKLSDGFAEYIARKKSILSGDSKERIVSTGWCHYDALIGGGHRKGALDLIVARPKTGKSFVAMQRAYLVAKQDIDVLLLDTELDEDMQMTRLLSIIGNVPLNYLDTGIFLKNSKYKERVKKAYNELKKLPLDYVEIKGYNLAKQLSTIRNWHAKRKDKSKIALVILDYLKIMDIKDKGFNTAEWEALGHHMMALHDLIGKLKISMQVLAQQNRLGMDEQHEGTVSGSDRLAFFCDSLSIMFKKRFEDLIADYENPERDEDVDPPNIFLKTVLARHGPGSFGNEKIAMYCDIHNPQIPKNKICGAVKEINPVNYRENRRRRAR